jgi:RecJ-like exonuclease
MNIKPLLVPLIVVVFVAGMVWYLARPQAEAYGQPGGESAGTVPIGELGHSHVGRRVAIEGTIKRECPSTGCWAVIEDDTGQVRIDTQEGGFALPLHREGSKVRVVGKVTEKGNGDVEISAESAEL